MIVPKSNGKYRYEFDGVEYTLTIVNHSMFIGDCEVEIEFEGQKVFKSISWNDLLLFLNNEEIKVREEE